MTNKDAELTYIQRIISYRIHKDLSSEKITPNGWKLLPYQVSSALYWLYYIVNTFVYYIKDNLTRGWRKKNGIRAIKHLYTHCLSPPLMPNLLFIVYTNKSRRTQWCIYYYYLIYTNVVYSEWINTVRLSINRPTPILHVRRAVLPWATVTFLAVAVMIVELVVMDGRSTAFALILIVCDDSNSWCWSIMSGCLPSSSTTPTKCVVSFSAIQMEFLYANFFGGARVGSFKI